MKTSDEFLSMVNEFLANLPYDRKPYSLYEPVKYVLSLGGKRIRPVLMLLGYNIFKEDPEKILMVMKPFTRSGTPIPPSFQATVCWCSPTTAWLSATTSILPR